MDNQKLMLSTPHIKLNSKTHPKPNLRLVQLKLGKLEFLGVTSHKHDNGIIEKMLMMSSSFFQECEVNMTS